MEKTLVTENFPGRLQELIDETGIKKSHLAQQVGIGASAVTQMLKGESGASKRTIKAMAEVFSVSEEWLEYGTGEKRIEQPTWQPVQIHQALTPEEDEVLKRFRNLDERHRANIMEMLHCYEALNDQSGRKEPREKGLKESNSERKSAA